MIYVTNKYALSNTDLDEKTNQIQVMAGKRKYKKC